MIVIIYKGSGWLFKWRWRLFDDKFAYTRDRSKRGYFSKWSATKAAHREFGDKYPIRVDYP